MGCQADIHQAFAPGKQRLQRARDELLFWQTAISDPCTCDLVSGQVFAARCLVSQNLSISSGYLIDMLKSNEDALGSIYHRRVAFPIIMVQQDYSTIPALEALTKSKPYFLNDIKRVLRDFDTPEARTVLQNLQHDDFQLD